MSNFTHAWQPILSLRADIRSPAQPGTGQARSGGSDAAHREAVARLETPSIHEAHEAPVVPWWNGLWLTVDMRSKRELARSRAVP